MLWVVPMLTRSIVATPVSRAANIRAARRILVASINTQPGASAMRSYPSISIATAMIVLVAGLAPTASGSPSRCPDCTAGGRPDTLVAHPASSSIRWTGMKLPGTAASEGTVALTRGELVLRHGELTGGSFTVDMRRLQVTSLPAGNPDRGALRARLSGADGFDVERFPTAAFVAKRAVRTGDSTYRVSGDLTIHGVTRPVSFSSDVHWVEVGHMVATAGLSIDRRAWGIAAAGPSLADRVVDDQIQLTIRLDARRRGAVVAER
jgi:polyisoprenoid-binding protein YceI